MTAAPDIDLIPADADDPAVAEAVVELLLGLLDPADVDADEQSGGGSRR